MQLQPTTDKTLSQAPTNLEAYPDLQPATSYGEEYNMGETAQE